MFFADTEENYISIDKDKIKKFAKKGNNYLEIVTTEICCELHYNYSDDRDIDYDRLKEMINK